MLEGFWAHGVSSPGSYSSLRRTAESAASGNKALRRTDEQKARIETFEQQIGRLTLSRIAVWSRLPEKHGLAEEDLLAKIEEIDLRDREADGCVHLSKPKRHAACDRTASPIDASCI